jgi:hypothetical protein
MSFFTGLGEGFAILWAIVANTWWLWLPPLLFFFGHYFWLLYLKVRYFSNLQWVLLEVRLPREMPKSPQAMEQVFAGLQTMFFEFDPLEKYWQGLQHDYLVFELASLGGETRFYIRTPVFFRNVVEGHIYAQYPEVEIAEVEDYLNRFPGDIPNEEWDMFGVEFSLYKPDAYPIRTYIEFPTIESMKEETRKVDPFSAMAELAGKIGPGEHLGYHLLLRPVQNDKWKKEGEKLVDKLIGKRVKPQKWKIEEALEPIEPVFQGWGEPIGRLFGLPPSEAPKPTRKEEISEVSLMQHLSPGTKDIVAAIERNILKPGFEVIVRFCYLAPRTGFSLSHLSSFIGALKQFNTQTMNGFKMNSAAMATRTAWWWPTPLKRKRKIHKQRLFYQYYRLRKPFTDTWTLKSTLVTLNTEELATIYHYPGMTAKAPLMPRLEAKRAEPPTTLPIG